VLIPAMFDNVPKFVSKIKPLFTNTDVFIDANIRLIMNSAGLAAKVPLNYRLA
jgi:hypothetical protein